MAGEKYNALVDIKNVTSIHYDKNKKCLYVNGEYITSKNEDIDKFINGWCGYHQFDVDIIKEKLLGD
jgi:hypothetical protein